MLFVLPYQMILRQLGVDPAAVKSLDTVTIPRPLLELLLRMLIVRAAFDEADYLARNPDVQAAVQAGQLHSGHDHFLSVGYLEGRDGGSPVVDENWYVHAYADVARAVAQGKLANGADHYFSAGVHEWRIPAADAAQAVAAWRSVLIQPQAAPQPAAPASPASIVSSPKPNTLADANPASTSRMRSRKTQTAKPTTVKPTTGKPAAAEPATGKPATGKPATGKPAIAKPAIAKPAIAKPAIAKPAIVEPGTADPASVASKTVKPEIDATAPDAAAVSPLVQPKPVRMNGSPAAKPAS